MIIIVIIMINLEEFLLLLYIVITYLCSVISVVIACNVQYPMSVLYIV